jgi:hypothetical protein
VSWQKVAAEVHAPPELIEKYRSAPSRRFLLQENKDT